MRISESFVVRTIADETMLVPMGKVDAQSGIITANDVGKFLLHALAKGCSREELLRSVTEEYTVTQETAAADLDEFLDSLREIGALEESNE